MDTTVDTGRVGVLALQGDVREHARTLADLGVDVVEVRTPEDLALADALVIPGGESTTMSLLIDSAGLRRPLAQRLDAGMATFGTCAGMILLAREVSDGRPDQVRFGAIDISVRRNAFGRQVDSFETELQIEGVTGSFHAVFIRAPVVEEVGPGVEVLAEVGRADGGTRPVLCRQGPVMVAAFHPELSGDSRIHAMFLDSVRAAGGNGGTRLSSSEIQGGETADVRP